MLKGLFGKIVGDANARELKRLQPIVDQINALEPEYERLSNEELRACTEAFKQKVEAAVRELRAQVADLQQQVATTPDADRRRDLEIQLQALTKRLREAEEEVLNALLPRAFAVVREAAKRTLGERHFDVQLMGGIVLHQGKIAEMKTGEGKTLVATLPLYLNALLGRGAHLVTPNDYLSKFGVQWMGPIYHLLGLTVGVIQTAAENPQLSSFVYDPEYPATDDRYQNLRPVPRREAYLADITYGTNNEFGFDYLRDNMVWDLSQCVQRELHYAIVDEVDNILIDEARTPLIISGPAEESTDNYIRFARLVKQLRPEIDYTVDEKLRIVTLTEEGTAKVERALGIDNLYSPEHYGLTPYLENALKAEVLFKADRDYIVKDGQVIIVDEFTGRLMFGRRYSEGLHQAIEAKEGVRVQRESLTLATISFQNYFRMYNKLAGMTGTAATEAEEFQRIYGLDVVVIPTHKPMIRVDYPDQVYKTENAKFRAVVREIEELYHQGRPVLVGTTSVEKSEMLSEMLRRKGIPHQVLNAKQHEKEAMIIAQAGRSGAVTIATNMAGRGVDILLGGKPEGLARDQLRRQGVDLTQVDAQTWAEALAHARQICAADREKVLALGGLHVIGTERHEARRIDNQLRGRSGRQGDPGSSRFYVSLEDDLMKRFGGSAVAGLMDRLGVDEDIPIEHELITRSIENAQIKVEGYNFDLRKHLLEYDDVVNQQRKLIYDQRRLILTSETLKDTILGMVQDELSAMVMKYTTGDPIEWDLPGLWQAVRAILPLPEKTRPHWESLNAEQIEEQLLNLSVELYEAKERQLGAEMMRQLERLLMLHVVDSHWVRHLTALDELREGIGLRAFGQRDPLIEYKREAFDMFEELKESIAHDIARRIYFTTIVRQPVQRPVQAYHPGSMDPGASRGAAPVRAGSERGRPIGRNDPCPCGSGRKYKNCCMRKNVAGGQAAITKQAAGAQQVAKSSAKHCSRKKKRK
nr:preprotein translocase subunit SecA [Chloroflexota bacterium]